MCEETQRYNDLSDSEWVDALADSEHMQLSASKFVKFSDLQMAYAEFCHKRDKVPVEVTRMSLARYSMTLKPHAAQRH